MGCAWCNTIWPSDSAHFQVRGGKLLTVAAGYARSSPSPFWAQPSTAAGSVLWGGVLILKRQNPGDIYGPQVASRLWGPALAVGDGATAQKYQHLTSVCSSPQEPLFAPTAASGAPS